MIFILGCPNGDDLLLLEDSTIVFEDGLTVTVELSDESYINNISGVGEGIVNYSSNNDEVAIVDASSGVVTLYSTGTVEIDVTKDATEEHSTISSSYTLTVTEGVSNDYVSENIGILKYIPSGSYQRDSESSNISIVTDPFVMGQFEITRGQFLNIMGSDPSDVERSTSLFDPVQMVNWYHAIAFCNKLSILEGLTPVYSVEGVDFSTITFDDIPGNPRTSDNNAWDDATADWDADGYRLPTELEWMWAAMGADNYPDSDNNTINTTGYMKEFAGSTGDNVVDDFVVYSNNSGPDNNNEEVRTTKTVGSKTNGYNEVGLYDMSGNVFEWCWDRRLSYPPVYPSGTILSDSVEGKGDLTGRNKVIRGGSWFVAAQYCTVAFRFRSSMEFQSNHTGFRVVRNFNEPD